MDRVDLVLRYAREPISLNTPVAADGAGDGVAELGDLVPDDAPGPAATVAAASIRPCLDAALRTLSEREVAVLTQRFGLDDDQPRTLDEIGRRHGLTRERVRQIEAKALNRLRQPSRARVLADLNS